MEPNYLHLYGIINGVYLSVVMTTVLYGISYLRDKRYNWRVGTALLLIAVAFTCFALYNILYTQTHTNPTTSIYPNWFIKMAMVVSPLSIIILTMIYTRAFAMRSILAEALLRKSQSFKRMIYVTSALAIVALTMVDDARIATIIILLNFIPPTLAAGSLSIHIHENNRVNIGYGILFYFLFCSTIFNLWMLIADVHFSEQYYFVNHGFFALVMIFSCFFSIRYGHHELQSFFRIRELDQYGILTDIIRAVGDSEMTVYYQPQVSLQSDRPVGVEALIRWYHPVKGWITPLDFIPLAEQTQLINTITNWVITTSVKQVAKLHEMGNPLTLSINFSPRDFTYAVTTHLIGELERYNFPPEYLIIEITENLIMRHHDKEVQQALELLEDLGVKISIDDYGTGFSSLSYLTRMPIYELKVDRHFIKNLASDKDSQAIVHYIFQLTQSLKIKSVAEGVEDADTIDALKELGCDLVQGYGIAKPMSYDDLTTWLSNTPKPITAAIA